MAKSISVWDGTQFVPANVPVGAVPNAVAVYNSVAPLNPKTGQIWNDTSNNLLKIWSGSEWISYAPTNSPTFSGTVTASTIISDISLISNGLTTLSEVTEILNSGTVSASVFTADATNGNVFYVTAAPTSNFTINITNLPTTENRVFSFSFFVLQGATGYIPNALQISGASQTIKWSNGTVPSATNGAGKLDVFGFSLIKRSNAWEVLGSVDKNY
jgi:hypothetical protein